MASINLSLLHKLSVTSWGICTLAAGCSIRTTFPPARSPLICNDVWGVTEGICTVTILTGFPCKSSLVSKKLGPFVHLPTESTCFSLVCVLLCLASVAVGEKALPRCLSLWALSSRSRFFDEQWALSLWWRLSYSHCTHKFSLCVNSLRFRESWFLCSRFSQSVHTKSFCIESLMCYEACLLNEGLTTFSASIGFLSSVS